MAGVRLEGYGAEGTRKGEERPPRELSLAETGKKQKQKNGAKKAGESIDYLTQPESRSSDIMTDSTGLHSRWPWS